MSHFFGFEGSGEFGDSMITGQINPDVPIPCVKMGTHLFLIRALGLA